VRWTGGAYHPGETPATHPWVGQVAGAIADERGAPPALAGVPWGADMRLFTARGIPCVMAGTTGIERAHAVDEWVAVDELSTLARFLVRAILRLPSSAVTEGGT
jgi:acetylornithine deacetylase